MMLTMVMLAYAWSLLEISQVFGGFAILSKIPKSYIKFKKKQFKIVAQRRESNLAIKVRACKLQPCLVVMYNEFNAG